MSGLKLMQLILIALKFDGFLFCLENKILKIAIIC